MINWYNPSKGFFLLFFCLFVLFPGCGHKEFSSCNSFWVILFWRVFFPVPSPLMRPYLQLTGVVGTEKFLQDAHPCVLYSESLAPPKYHNKSTNILQHGPVKWSEMFMICCVSMHTSCFFYFLQWVVCIALWLSDGWGQRFTERKRL